MKNLLANPLFYGGVIPAVLYGIVNILAKIVGKRITPYETLMIGGLAIFLVGLGGLLFYKVKPELNLEGYLGSFFYGLFWGVGSLLVLKALADPRGTVSQIVPLFNMNTLVAIFLALIIFREFEQVNVVKVILGAIFIVTGGILVS